MTEILANRNSDRMLQRNEIIERKMISKPFAKDGFSTHAPLISRCDAAC